MRSYFKVRLFVHSLAIAAGLSLLLWAGLIDAEEVEDAVEDLEEVVVTAVPNSILSRSTLGSFSLIDSEDIDLVKAAHPHEIFARIPGVWIVQNSGQEHLAGMRSAVLTGAGACGAYLILEDNIPVRPTGFCNVNGLFELNTEQAANIEVMRGPSSSLYGGNALLGAINVQPFSNSNHQTSFSIGGGRYGYFSVRTRWDDERIRAKLLVNSTDGFRESTDHTNQKLNVLIPTLHGLWSARHSVSVSNLDQETGGYIRGFEAYKDNNLKKSNPNPEAYRKASSLRVSSQWFRANANSDTQFATYLRNSEMKFLQHFLPGQPTEENGQTSIGSVLVWSKPINRGEWSIGTQVDFMTAELSQTQESPTVGSPFLVATRPVGTHYDYSVGATTASVFERSQLSLGTQHEIQQELQVELSTYRYDNHHLNGNTRDDGSHCGFGGCLYIRPGDRSDTFVNLAGRLGYTYTLSDDVTVWSVAGLSYRPPQTTELYRLQSGQEVADLQSEYLTSIELGLSAQFDQLTVQLAGYKGSNSNVIFRDAEGFNVDDGSTQSIGMEWELTWVLNDWHSIAAVGTFAKHEYGFTRRVSRGESIVDGNEVDTAPRTIANLRWQFRLSATVTGELEANHISKHYVNAANSAEYEGHTVMNFRTRLEVSNRWNTFLRIHNLLDVDYANRADFAFGHYRYFPGEPRRAFLGIEWQL